eukprot:4835448-Amphidinium_carterae.1
MQDREPVRETLASLQEQIQIDFGTAEASAGSPNVSISTGSASVMPHLTGADASDASPGEPVRTSGYKRGTRIVPSHSCSDRATLVCFQCLPVVVHEG